MLMVWMLSWGIMHTVGQSPKWAKCALTPLKSWWNNVIWNYMAFPMEIKWIIWHCIYKNCKNQRPVKIYWFQWLLEKIDIEVKWWQLYFNIKLTEVSTISSCKKSICTNFEVGRDQASPRMTHMPTPTLTGKGSGKCEEKTKHPSCQTTHHIPALGVLV
jgi:hypothetical protein